MHKNAFKQDEEFEKVELELCFSEAALVVGGSGCVGMRDEEEIPFPLKSAEESLGCVEVCQAGCIGWCEWCRDCGIS